MLRSVFSGKLINIYKLFLFVDKKIRNKSLITFIIVIFAGIIESLVILLIVPFAREILLSGQSMDVIYLRKLSILLGFSVILSGILRSSALRNINYNSALIVNNLAKKIYQKLIFHKYRDIKSPSAKEMISKITFLDSMLTGFVCPIWALITNIVIASMIFIVLYFRIGAFAIYGLLIIISCYLFIYGFIKNKVSNFDKLQKKNKAEALHIINTTINGIRDIRVNYQEDQLIKSFNLNDFPLRKSSALINTMAGLPRIILENLVFLIFALYAFLRSSESSDLLIPDLAILLVVFQRLMPLGQSIYGSLISINSNNYIVESCLEVFNDLPQIKTKEKLNFSSLKRKLLNFALINVSYVERGKNILENINLELYPNKIIGIYGKSGSGKSTLLDIISGLINQTSGKIICNQKEINSSQRISLTSMVSQSSYLFSGSIKYNVTFKNNLTNKEYQRMVDCCRIACIDNFIDQLKDNYDFVLGSSSFNNVSGGQKQRICIARALYNNSNILILDEITSSLDQETSAKILNFVKIKLKDLIIILVSHKPEDLKVCDDLYFLKNGNLIRKK